MKIHKTTKFDPKNQMIKFVWKKSLGPYLRYFRAEKLHSSGIKPSKGKNIQGEFKLPPELLPPKSIGDPGVQKSRDVFYTKNIKKNSTSKQHSRKQKKNGFIK